MTVLILEDEKPAAEKLAKAIRTFDASINLVGPLQSVRDAVEWLTNNPHPDLIVADIQLTDGLSLEVFRTLRVSTPVVFATAYDAYLLEALEQNSIDYLLKPVKQEKLEGALRKYLRLKQHFTANLGSFVESFGNSRAKKDRLLVKKGIDFLSLRTEEIAYFYTEHKVAFLVDRNGVRYIHDEPLSALEHDLDSSMFFRANRKFLVHINSVKSFKPLERGRLLIELSPPIREEVVVSQENAAAFKRWMGK